MDSAERDRAVHLDCLRSSPSPRNHLKELDMFSPYEVCQLTIQLVIAGFFFVIGYKVYKLLQQIRDSVYWLAEEEVTE